MSKRTELEGQLHSALKAHLAIYEEAIPLAESLAERYDLSEACQTKMDQLDKIMQRAAAHEASMAGLKAAWSSEFAGQSSEIQSISRQLAERIELLIKLTSIVEKRALDCKSSLEPQLDTQLKIKKAQAAYSLNQ